MSADAILAEIIARVPEWRDRPREVTRLDGGLTNRNFRVDVDGGAYVVRIGGHNTELLGIDRRHEYECNVIAAEVGVAPAVVAFFPELSSMITCFIVGSKVSGELIGTRTNIERVARSVRALHGARRFPSVWSPFRTIEAYRHTAERLGSPLPVDVNLRFAQLEQIERALYRDSEPLLFPCHNDLLNENFLDDGTIRIVDYEYAAMGDPLFDLANFSSHHRLSAEQDRWLLESYLGGAETPWQSALTGPGVLYDASAERRPASRPFARLQLMKLVSDLREAMWGIVQIKLSKLEFDYQAYADDWFGRFDAKWKQLATDSPELLL